VVCYLPCFRQWLITCPLSLPVLPAFPAVCLLIVQAEFSSLPFSPSPVRFQHSHSLCCVLVFSSLFIVQFFFLLGGRSVCPGGYAGLSQGCLGEYCVMLCAHLFGLPNVSQAGLELAVAVVRVAAAAAHLFSQCNVA
jgi:hypothetical protein